MSRKIDMFESVLSNPYNHSSFVDFVREFLNDVELIAPDLKKGVSPHFYYYVDGYYHIGNYQGDNGEKIAVFSVALRKGDSVERSRTMQRNFVKPLIEAGNCDGALVAFYTPEKPDKWRLSFIRLDYEFSKGKVTEKLTPAKRYSYLVGEGEPCNTAKQRLFPIFQDDTHNPGIDDLEEAFSVEKVTSEFFQQYCEKYHELREYLESNEDFVQEAQIRNFTSEQFAKKLLGQIVFLYFIQKKGWLGVDAIPVTMTEKEYKNAFFARGKKSRDIVGSVYAPQSDGSYRVVFDKLCGLSDEDEDFLAGIVKGKPWGTGPKDFMRKMFEGCVETGKNYFDDYLEPLFYTGLNLNRGENGYYPPLHRRIPFLNGGLFEQLDNYEWENNNFDVPNSLFSNAEIKGKREADGILDIFDRYNFTMNEDEPMEREVAIDPEMLGKVFENLLDVKDRKSKGAFYTPREIVHYMCQETLINYLVTKTGISENAIREFILCGEYLRDEDTAKTVKVTDSSGKCHYEIDKNKNMLISEEIFSYKNNVNRLKEIDDLLANVKVADLAVGSGAFPLGMLNEIVRARQVLTEYLAIDMNGFQKKTFYAYERKTYDLKVNTIKNCIFACDIEPSAVDIAKLRLWLSIVIDDEIADDAGNGEFDVHTKPRQLPNLDCNIICGDSLLTAFKGVELITSSELLGNNDGVQQTLFQQGVDKLLKKPIKLQDDLFFTKDHIEKNEIKKEIQSIYNEIILQQIGNNIDLKAAYIDSLDDSSKPFILWQLFFPRVFRDNAGFDIVIGNPPYRLCQPSNTDEYHLNYYKNEYRVSSYKIDLFHLFFEKGINLLREGGSLSYITPNTYLTNKYIKPLRQYILNHCSVRKIINHDKVFAAASVDTATIIMTKEKRTDGEISVLQSNNFVLEEICKKKQADWEADKDYIFNINKADALGFENCATLGDICKTYFGIQAYDRKSSVSEKKLNEKYLPIIDGADVHTYEYSIPKLYFNYLPENIKSGGDWNVYSKERIVVRQIGKLPIVGLCEKNILASNTLYSIWTKDDSYELRYIIACLNSEIIRNYWAAKYSDNKVLFPKIKGFQLKELPIPKVEISQQKEVTNLVDKIIDMKADDREVDILEIESEINNILRKHYGQ